MAFNIDAGYNVIFFHEHNGVKNAIQHEAVNESLPLAISRAFLATKGLEP